MHDDRESFALDLEMSRFRREYGHCMPFEDARVKLSNDADAMAEIVSDAACDQTFIAWLDQTVAKAWRGGLSGCAITPQHVRDTLDDSARRVLSRWGWTEPAQEGDQDV